MPENIRQGWKTLALRSATGIPALLGVLAMLVFAPWQVSALLILIAGLLGLCELRGLLAREREHSLPLLPLLAGGGAILLGSISHGAAGQQGMLFAALALWLLVCLLRCQEDHRRSSEELAFGVLGLIWVPWLLSHWVLLLKADPHWCAWLLLVLTGSDMGGYLVGRLLGRHPLLNRISPNKTVEGLLGCLAGGMLGGLLGAYGLPWFQLEPGLLPLLLLSTALALLAQLGDYGISLLKRSCGLKDSGWFLPGHGGLLDRMDSLLLGAPLLYHARIQVL